MNDTLQTIFEGAVYTLTILLILASAFFVILATVEATTNYYWQAFGAVSISGLCFSIVLITSRFLRKEEG